MGNNLHFLGILLIENPIWVRCAGDGMKHLYRVGWLGVCVALLVGGCGDGATNGEALENNIPVVTGTLVVEPYEITLAMHETHTLRAEVRDDGGELVEAELVWTSEDEEVATVDGDGQVLGVGAGQTKLVVTSGGLSASVDVTVHALGYRSVSVGSEHSCAVKWNGDVYCWGGNVSARLGLADPYPTAVPSKVDLPEPMESVAVAVAHSCALSHEGNAYCWGHNGQSQLGVGSTSQYLVTPTRLEGLRFQMLALATYHSCGVTLDGELYCWGDNFAGALGNSGIRTAAKPQHVALENKAVQVVVSEYNTCVLDNTGAAFCFGSNESRLLLPFQGEMSPVPQRVGGDALFTSLALGAVTACGVTVEGTTLCWGGEFGYTRGRAEVTTYLPEPIDSSERFVALSGGPYSFCGRNEDGQLHCWGFNRYGGLGDGTSQSRLPGPVTGAHRWSQVAVGSMHSCGIALDGDLWCWGDNSYGQVGDGRAVISTEPVRVAHETIQLANLMSSDSGTCGRQKGSSKYFCWGANQQVQFGVIEGGGHATKPMLLQYPERQWKQLSLGKSYSCGLTGIGQAFCWGSNQTWQLGTGVVGPGNWGLGAVSTNLGFDSIYAGYQHTCALTGDGQAYCWGYNSNGQLGLVIEDSNGANKPVAVATNLRFVELALGNHHTCGLTADGKVYCWGDNSWGTLGSTRPDFSSTPVAVALDEPVVTLKSGANHACGLSAGGKLHCWGYNYVGTLGVGSELPAQGAVTVDGTWSDFKTTDWTMCARKSGGELFCWGYNAYQQLDASGKQYLTRPQQVDPGFVVQDYSVGGGFICMLDEGGVPHCQGLNAAGSLGNDAGYNYFAPQRVVGVVGGVGGGPK